MNLKNTEEEFRALITSILNSKSYKNQPEYFKGRIDKFRNILQEVENERMETENQLSELCIVPQHF